MLGEFLHVKATFAVQSITGTKKDKEFMGNTKNLTQTHLHN